MNDLEGIKWMNEMNDYYWYQVQAQVLRNMAQNCVHRPFRG